MMTRILFLITVIVGCVIGFTPHQTFQPAKVVKGMTHWGMDGTNQQQKQSKATTSCFLSSPGGEQPETSESKKAVPDSTLNTYYDDEVEPVVNAGISNSMKERLMREASTGLDPDRKNTNVLLYIIGAVAILVILGGSGTLY